MSFKTYHRLALLLLLAPIACNNERVEAGNWALSECDDPTEGDTTNHASSRGALLGTEFHSLEELKTVIHIQYFRGNRISDSADERNTVVRLSHCSGGTEIVSTLKSGISQTDVTRAQEGSVWDKLWLGINSPYTVINRVDLQRVYLLARRRGDLFEANDVAFFNLAERMVDNISDYDRARIHPRHFSEKGYLNTFNHITAQSFVSTIFSEALADYMGDAHELSVMPELVTGRFSQEQLTDTINNPVDNYIDLVNNEWGRELGNAIKDKFAIKRVTHWTPELLADYLNEVQGYLGWACQLGFRPFRSDDEEVVRFANKINRVMGKDARWR